jgi:uncharacterized membrane protein YbaN (DUF454 family)
MKEEVLIETDKEYCLTGSSRPVSNLIGYARWIYIIFGVIFLGIGAIGTVLPLIPTTPFVVLAAICFSKSSPKIHAWFLSTKFYKRNIDCFVRNRAMTIKSKVTLLISITLFMATSFYAMIVFNAPLVAQVILIIVWVCHILYFGFKIKTTGGEDIAKKVSH